MKGQRITITKDGAKSSDGEIDEYLAFVHIMFYTKNSGHLN